MDDVTQGEQDLKTPKTPKLAQRLQVETMSDDDTVNVEDIITKPHFVQELIDITKGGQVPADFNQAVSDICSDWSKVGENFSFLSTRIASLGSGHENLRKNLEAALKQTEDKLKLLDTKACILSSRMGSRTSNNDDQRALWPTVEEL